MDTADAFRAAMAAHQVAEADALLSPHVVFRSPVVHRTYRGRNQVMPILHAVSKVLKDFRYHERFTSESGAVVLTFSGRVGERDLDGVDQLTFDADGLVSELAVYMRPLSALTVLRDAMAAELAIQHHEHS